MALRVTTVTLGLLALDEHGEGRRRHLADLVHQPAHALALALELGEGVAAGDLASQLVHLAEQPAVLDGAAHREDDLVVVDGAGEEVVRAEAGGLDGGGDLAVGGQHDDREVGRRGLDAPQGLQPVDAGHVEVEDDHRGRGAHDAGQGESRGLVSNLAFSQRFNRSCNRPELART